ncbi:hypothetical protein Q8G48_28710, partial [Klebsiella pneumoniae]|uniref:hypothetical protein n=1 Tax=Klebsiella pneumoniae TaxID=573 RepID=UPI003013C838
MIRLLVYSEDAKLQPLLTPALGPEYSVTVESSPDRIGEIVADDSADVLILDFDSRYSSIEGQLAFYDGLGDCR